MSQRISVFSNPVSDTGLDLSSFKAKGRRDQRPDASEIDRASEGSRFVSRESVETPGEDRRPADIEGRRKPRAYRTGRNRVMSVKTTEEYAERFYAIAERLGMKVSETFERAVEALEREGN